MIIEGKSPVRFARMTIASDGSIQLGAVTSNPPEGADVAYWYGGEWRDSITGKRFALAATPKTRRTNIDNFTNS